MEIQGTDSQSSSKFMEILHTSPHIIAEFLPYLVAKVAAGHVASAAISAPPDAALDGAVQEDLGTADSKIRLMESLSTVVGAIRIDYDSLISIGGNLPYFCHGHEVH